MSSLPALSLWHTTTSHLSTSTDFAIETHFTSLHYLASYTRGSKITKDKGHSVTSVKRYASVWFCHTQDTRNPHCWSCPRVLLDCAADCAKHTPTASILVKWCVILQDNLNAFKRVHFCYDTLKVTFVYSYALR